MFSLKNIISSIREHPNIYFQEHLDIPISQSAIEPDRRVYSGKFEVVLLQNLYEIACFRLSSSLGI